MALIKKIIINPFYMFRSSRDVKFDLLKLWALLSVILDHSLQRWVENSQYLMIYNFIFLSQMPIFMFVAGYFAYYQLEKNKDLSKKELLRYLLKKIVSLLIPFVSFALLSSLILKKYSNVYLCFLYPQKSLWFLWSLMWLEIITFFAQVISFMIEKNEYQGAQSKGFIISLVFYFVFLIPFVVLYILNSSLFDSKLICYYSLFFLLGYVSNFLFFKKQFLRNIVSNMIIGLTSLLGVIIIMILRPTIINDEDTIINTCLRIIGSSCSVFFVYEICFFVSKLRFMDFVSRLGRLSLEFYYVHLLLFCLPILNTYCIYIYEFFFYYFCIIICSFLVIIISN